MKNGWTAERRARQAEAIRRWQPWAKSTGPRSAEGKATSSKNAHRVTIYKCLKMATYLLKQRKRFDAGLPYDSREVVQRKMDWAINCRM